MFAVLHIADFALHAVLRTEPGSTGQPAALFTDASKKSVVIATTAAARIAGVEPGMTAPQAVARCSRLLIRAAKPDAEREARSVLQAMAFTLSPAIEDTAAGVCTADVRSLDPVRSQQHAAAAVAQLWQLGLPATAGIARTPLLALYAARAVLPESSAGAAALKSQAPSPARFELNEAAASYHCPSNGVLIVADETRFLAPLPLSVADPAPELASVLQGWGLRTLGDLTALPRDEIIRRFGADGLALWSRASGGEQRPLRPVIPPQEFFAQIEFEQEVETLEPLLFILRRFLDRLALELRASQHVAAEIELTLKLEDETTHRRSFRLPEPTADVEILFRTLHTHLESLSTAAAVVALQLRLTPARPLVRQQGLFETGLRDAHGFAETLARIGALVGSDRVGTPRLADTHRPDALVIVPPEPAIPPPAPEPLHPPVGPVLRRFRPPQPVRLELVDNRPTYLWTEQVRGEIAEVSRSYSSSGDWWETSRAWARTEWDVRLADGGLYRVIKIDHGYFLEGEYD